MDHNDCLELNIKLDFSNLMKCSQHLSRGGMKTLISIVEPRVL